VRAVLTLASLTLATVAAGVQGTPAGAGESLYVIEQLVVNVNSAPDASGERIDTVKSGERVDVIERLRDQVHVRLADGRDGWIRASYLSADEPLRGRLAQREAEVAQLREDVRGLEAQLEAAHAAGKAATGTAARGDAATGTTAAGIAAADGSPRSPAATAPPADESARPMWPWVLGAALLALCLGFVLGAITLDRHIRRKYGGLRIY
jgi:SH3-like domain-containing protein